MGTVGSLHYSTVCFNGCKEFMQSGWCGHTYVSWAKRGLLDLSRPWVKPEQKKSRKGPTKRKKQLAAGQGGGDHDLVSGSAAEAQVCRDKVPAGWKTLTKQERLECLRMFYPR